MPLPADDPPTAAKVALGRKLFFDRRLSVNGTMSCGMCHLPEQGFTNHELARPIGVEGRSLRRNAPTLLNVAFMPSLFHDGRGNALETQALGPLLDRREMANPSLADLLARIAHLPDYQGRFEAAFGEGPSAATLGRAIAAYERTLLLAASPFDRQHYGGVPDTLDEEARRGFGLFAGKAGCSACHRIGERHALFTDHAYHDTGIAWRNAERRRLREREEVVVPLAPGVTTTLPLAAVMSVGLAEEPDLGRQEVTGEPADRYKIRTPSLRNVALTAPYMHDGSLPTLAAVVRHYDRGGVPHAGQDARLQPLGLSETEIGQLVRFLASLTGDGLGQLIEEARAEMLQPLTR